MPKLQQQRQQQILQRFLSNVIAESGLTDVADTAVMKHLGAAFARELDEAYYQMTRVSALFDVDTAAGDDLDERAAEIQPGTLTRVGARSSIGQVIFSRNTSTGSVTIPSGSVVRTAEGIEFATTSQTTILDTQTSSPETPVVAVEPGLAGNVGANTVVKFSNRIPGVDSVTNNTTLTGGLDKESDDSFRGRIKGFIASLSRCTVEALEFISKGIEDSVTNKTALFTHVFEDPVDRGNVILYIDDGAGTAATDVLDIGLGAVDLPTETVIAAALGGEEFLDLDNKPLDIDTVSPVITSNIRGVLTNLTDYNINPASGRIFFSPALVVGEEITAQYRVYTGLIAAVQKVVDGDANDRTNFPGYRAAGVLVRVLSPVVISLGVTAGVTGVSVQLTLPDGSDFATASAAAQNAILDYINNRGISGDIIRNELIERIMSATNATDINLVTPVANLVVNDDEIARISTANITIT